MLWMDPKYNNLQNMLEDFSWTSFRKYSRTADPTQENHNFQHFFKNSFRVHRPSIEDHFQQLGPLQLALTGQLMGDHNAQMGQSFSAVSKFLKLYEAGIDGWHVAIHGHLSWRTFPLTEMKRRELQRLQVFTVSHLFEVQDNAQFSNHDNAELFGILQ